MDAGPRNVTNNSALLNYYLNNLVQMVQTSKPNASMIFWQEVLDQDVAPPGTIGHVWKGNSYDEQMQEMATVTAAGHNAIFSSCWYINIISYGSLWQSYYNCDPAGFNGTDDQKARVLGGEACIWGEFVDGSNLIPRLWPNAATVAEKLWTPGDQTTEFNAAWPRLHEARCRMLSRGYQVQPANGPDFCPDFWDPFPDVSQNQATMKKEL